MPPLAAGWVAAAGRGPDSERPVPGSPRQYQVQLSLDGHPWGPAATSGNGAPLTIAA